MKPVTSYTASYLVPSPSLHRPIHPDVTSPAALAEVERFVLEATVFNSIRGGYVEVFVIILFSVAKYVH